MNADELLSLISYGESEVLEFKLDSVRNEHLARELGALANYRGGLLVLGISCKRGGGGVTRGGNEGGG